MFAPRFAAAALALLSAGALAAQQPDLASKIINDPGNPEVNGATARVYDDAGAQGGHALRVQVARKGQNPWDSTIGGAVLKPIKAGDNLILVFSAKLEKGENGAATATLPYNAVQLAGAPYSTVISGSNDIGPEWKTFQVTGKADKDYPAKALKVTFQLATARQTVDFGPIVLLDMGQ
jgi:hypothetical protein